MPRPKTRVTLAIACAQSIEINRSSPCARANGPSIGHGFDFESVCLQIRDPGAIFRFLRGAGAR
jgi:hypothetical protein